MLKNRARHDIKNALATALLAADTLTNHQDAHVKQYARFIIEAIDIALSRLHDPEPQDDPHASSAINSTL